MSTEQTYDTLLKNSLGYHPLYGNRLANHLPMALTALKNLGATNKQLENFYKHHHTKLTPFISSTPSEPLTSIKDHLGKTDYFSTYLHYFQQEINTHGYHAVLRDSLPILLPGLSASAFHAVIRLAYAVDAEHKADIAFSLAYWAIEFQAFNLEAESCPETLAEILKRLSSDWVNYEFLPGIISNRMQEVSQKLSKQTPLLPAQELSLDSIAMLCINAYAKKDDFTLLHTVTGCHAFRILSNYINDHETAHYYLWEAIVMAYLSTGLSYNPSTVETVSHNKPENWDKIKSLACTSNNDHVIKLVYTCWQENLFYNKPIYYQVAKQTVSK